MKFELQEADYIDCDQGTPEWHALRANKIGASDAASILGIGYKTATQLWRIKVGLDSTFVNAAMRRGSELEPLARRRFEQEMQQTFQPAVYVSKKYPWLMASLDGINDEGTAILEIKCGGDKLHMDAMAGIIPPYYYSQIQHQLAVTGLDVCYYYSYDGEESGAMIQVARDQAYIDDYIPKSKAFWDCIQSLTPPDKSSEPLDEIASFRMKQLREEWLDIQSLRSMLEEHEKHVREELDKLADGNDITGYGLTYSKVTRKGAVDYTQIPEIKGLALDVYRKPDTTYWKITIDKDFDKK